MTKPLTLDPRTKLIVVLVAGFLIFGSSVRQLLLLIAVMGVYALINGVFRSLPVYVIILLTYFLSDHLAAATQNFFFVSIAFFSYFAVCFLPALLAGEVLARTPTGMLMSAWQRLRLPNMVIIALAICLRFIPIAGAEIRAIHEMAAQRGISLLSLRGWSHPWRALESIFVPLMIRLLKISDQLAASAVTRGAEAPVRRSSIHRISMHRPDYIIIGIMLAMAIILLANRS